MTMIKSDYRIIAVDNDEEELARIVNAFKEIGSNCLPILYNIGDEVQIRKHIRIAFFDINFSIGNPSEADLLNIVSNALKAIIDKNNGPYALVFWSLHVEMLEQIKTHIENREKGNIPSPIIIGSIDKALTSAD